MIQRQRDLIIVSVTMPFIAALFLLLRLWSRHIQQAAIALDDYLIIIGWVLTGAICVIMIFAATFGHFGAHENVISSGVYRGYMSFIQADTEDKYWYAINIVYACANSTIKYSVLTLYRRIFARNHVSEGFTICWWLVIVFCIFYSLFELFSAIFACIPINIQWTRQYHPFGKCIYFTKWYLDILTGADLVADVFILALPIHPIIKLQITRKNKIIVLLEFCTISICMLTALGRLLYTTTFTIYKPEKDALWYSYDTAINTILTTCFAIIGACLPLCRPVFKHLLEKVRPHRRRSLNSEVTDRNLLTLHWLRDLEAGSPRAPSTIDSAAPPFRVTPDLN